MRARRTAVDREIEVPAEEVGAVEAVPVGHPRDPCPSAAPSTAAGIPTAADSNGADSSKVEAQKLDNAAPAAASTAAAHIFCFAPAAGRNNALACSGAATSISVTDAAGGQW